MNEFFVTVDKTKYIVDFDVLKTMCVQADKTPATEKEVTEIYDATEDGGLDASQKVIRELKRPGSAQNDTIMYDFVKVMLLQLLEMPSRDSCDMSFGDSLALNSLIKCGIVKKTE